MNRNGTLLDSGISKLTYYNEIPRTSDLLKSTEFTINTSPNLLISNFFIAPPTIRFDNMVEEAIFELNNLVTRQMDVPNPDDIINLSIEENGKKYANAKVNNEFQEYLQQKKFTGELIKAAANLNSSTIDPFSRTILSEEGIFFYLAYRSIEGNKIKDSEGIVSNILDSLGLIKSFINTSLVDKVVVKENLNVSDEEVKKLKKAISNKRISYFQGSPEKVIVKLIDDLKSGGSLYVIVIEFLNSGKVKLPRITNKDALAQKMVDYLIRIGYNEDLGDDDGDQPNAQDNNEEQGEPDDFEVIEGVGKVTKGKFFEAGITSFKHLAKYDVAGLKKKIKNPQVHIKYAEIIEQAKLISEGRFEDLVQLQKKLNKRQ